MSLHSIDSSPVVFGRYVLLRRLSRGGMGEIFLAKVGEIEGFEKPIVIKRLLPDLSRDRDFLRLFVEEAQIAIKLAHANIVPVYEVGMVNEQFFLAMQYIEGRDLRALLRRASERGRHIPPDIALFLGREVASGLAYAHRRTDETGTPIDLVHCDISPPNVLVSYEGEVRVIDFGIAKSAMQRAAANDDIGFGKFGYMAPEQLWRGALVDRRADIYATGVLLYEMLSGSRLFSFPPDVDYRHVARVVTAGNVAPPSARAPHLTADLDDLVLRAMRSDPAQRYASAEELRDALQQKLYTINPTISGDTLAALMRELFAEEMEADRQMLRSLSATDLQPYRSALHDGSTRTVSFALGELLSSSELVVAAGGSLAVPQTRPLGSAARHAAASPAPDDAELPPSGATRRRWMVGAALGLTTISLAALVVAYWSSPAAVVALQRQVARPRAPLSHRGGPAKRAAVDTGEGATGDDAAEVATVPRTAPDTKSPGAADAGPAVAQLPSNSAPDAAEPAGAAPIAFAPELVQRSHRSGSTKSARRIRSRRNNRRSGTRRAAGRRARKAVSSVDVQRKFRRVSVRYRRFARAYGGRFEREWQRILFANTFGKKNEESYRTLNELLDDLLRRMKQVQQGSGG